MSEFEVNFTCRMRSFPTSKTLALKDVRQETLEYITVMCHTFYWRPEANNLAGLLPKRIVSTISASLQGDQLPLDVQDRMCYFASYWLSSNDARETKPAHLQKRLVQASFISTFNGHTDIWQKQPWCNMFLVTECHGIGSHSYTEMETMIATLNNKQWHLFIL